MAHPPPNPLPPPSSPQPPPPLSSPPPLQPQARPWTVALPRASGAEWLAAVGTVMLIVAAVIVVAGQWESITPTTKFAGLVGSLLGIHCAAEAGRRRFPATASALAVLAATLTAPVGVAAASAVDARWPLCITVGGACAMASAEIQSHRWRVRPLQATMVAAAVMTAAGLAAITGVAVALVGAGFALVVLAFGATRRSVAVAVLIPLVPLLELLTLADIGSGTLVDLGAVGAAPWVPFVSSLGAAAVIAIAAQQRSSSALGVTAIAALLWGTVVTLVEAAPPGGVWFALPSAAVIVVELVAFVRDRSLFGRWADSARSLLDPVVGALGIVLPVLVLLWRGDGARPGGTVLGAVALPMSAAAAATVTAAVARWVRSDGDDFDRDLLTVGALGATLAAASVFVVDVRVLPVLALAGWFVSTVLTAWRHWIPASAAHIGWALLAAGSAELSPTTSTILLAVGTAMMLLACASSTSPWAHFGEIPVTTVIATALVVDLWPGRTTAIAAGIAVAAVAMTGIALMSRRFGPLDALALSAGGSALLVALETTPSGVSLALTLLSAQVVLYAATTERPVLAVPAAAVGCSSLISLWWTTGTNQLVIDRLAPLGIDGQDLALGAASVALLLAGGAVRSTFRPSTWLAYSPGLGLAFSWLLMSQRAVDGEWATFVTLLAGVVAVGIGGARRLGAALVFGTLALGGTLLISAGPRLADAPTWAWIAVGGAGLLGLAAWVERSERRSTKAQPASTT